MTNSDQNPPTNNIDLDKALKFLFDLLPQAGLILKKYFASGNYDSKSKGEFDFATQADIESDAFLFENLKKEFPNANFLTEETAPGDYQHFKELENVWIVDPLDATINFSRQNPNFGISVGLVSKGQPILGVVYIPMKKDFYWTTVNLERSFLNGKEIHVNDNQNLKKVIVDFDWSWDSSRNEPFIYHIQNLKRHVLQIRSEGCAVTAFAKVAQGLTDVYLEPGLKPWDVAAAAIILQNAGGKITKFDGTDWDVFEPEVLASNGVVHQQIIEILNK